MFPKFIAAALSLALGLTHAGSGLAAGEPLAKAATKRATTKATPKAAPKATTQATPQASSANILARAVFQSLLGEFALQRGEIKLGADAWSDLALRTRDPKTLARATEVAAFAREYDRALELSRLWL